ncbi:MAG TPA: DJ-1/PfpI family protein [Bacteroidales bacterium]|nr:DJ-1/PfpI family protein [Bacteroidales bacterium]
MKKVLLLLADGFESFEASAFIDVIGWNHAEGDMSTELFSCALKKEIKSSFNQKFIVDYLLDEIDIHSFDALAIPGGFEIYGFYNDAYNEKFLDVIRRFKTENKVIASICVGSLPVAKSGILINKNATVYDSVKRRKELLEFGANVLDQPIVLDDNIITSWNPSTAINVALLLLELLTSKANSDKVRKLMGF